MIFASLVVHAWRKNQMQLHRHKYCSCSLRTYFSPILSQKMRFRTEIKLNDIAMVMNQLRKGNEFTI